MEVMSNHSQGGFKMFSNKNNKLLFDKLIAEIGGNFLNSVIKKYDGDYRTQHFDSKSHLYSLIYFNIKGCKSLRELETTTSSNKKLKRMINVPSVSQFSRKNATRDYRIFEDIFYYLVNKASKKYGAVKLLKDIPPLKIVDSTVVQLAIKLAPQLKIDNERSGIKINTVFNGEYPEKVNIVKGNISDRRCNEGIFTEKGSIYVFDRGYYDYRWYDKLTESGIMFVTRGIKNALVMEERIIYSDPDKHLYDTEVIMGSTPGGNLTFNKYREIQTFDESGEPITFITNIFHLTTEEIIAIYKKRWQIEIFFKWIKQNLKIKKFIGYNENAVKIQIYCALISYLLIYISSKTINFNKSILTLTRVVKCNLLESYDEFLKEYFLTG